MRVTAIAPFYRNFTVSSIDAGVLLDLDSRVAIRCCCLWEDDDLGWSVVACWYTLSLSDVAPKIQRRYLLYCRFEDTVIALPLVLPEVICTESTKSVGSTALQVVK